mmetsp:Transcript_67642/g.161388  ORF Transcript_67642/g.161388 Transcript_67642/m.161388 type:complete len:225 (-) Transcript_67642:1528-2202(-)
MCRSPASLATGRSGLPAPMSLAPCSSASARSPNQLDPRVKAVAVPFARSELAMIPWTAWCRLGQHGTTATGSAAMANSSGIGRLRRTRCITASLVRRPSSKRKAAFGRSAMQLMLKSRSGPPGPPAALRVASDTGFAREKLLLRRRTMGTASPALWRSRRAAVVQTRRRILKLVEEKSTAFGLIGQNGAAVRPHVASASGRASATLQSTRKRAGSPASRSPRKL